MNIETIILAAGKSSRMGNITPKIMHKIGGLEMINHVLKVAYEANSSKIFLVCDKNLKLQTPYDFQIKRVYQKQKLGTAHAVECALNYLSGDLTLILCGDAPFIKLHSINQMKETLRIKNLDACLLLFNPKNPNSAYGRATIKKEIVENITEYQDLNHINNCSPEGDILANSGVMLVRTCLLKKYIPQIKNKNTQKEYYLTDIIGILNKNKKKVSYCKTEEENAVGVNSYEDLADAENIFQDLMRAKAIKSGVLMPDAKVVYFSYDTALEPGSFVGQNVIFGQGVKVSAGAKIMPFCYIENAEIGKGSKIGPFAKVRGKTEIKECTHIGSFVEVKNSKIHDNVKVKHLSYIGDAQIEENTNIGAGTVICNFDGKKKHTTTIEKNCFIGANNSIVSPLKIKESAKTAAGSTITHDVQKNNIAIARARQINKLNED